MKEKLLLLLICLIILISCNENYSESKYPQSVIATVPYTHVMRYHEFEVDSLTALPENIQHKITQHLKGRLGSKFTQLNYESIDIWSNKPIKISEFNKPLVHVLLYGNDSITKATGTGIDSIYNYPLYSTIFKLKVPEVGIEELRLQLVIDKDTEIIKDIEYPKNGFQNFIHIDSIHSELIRREISSHNLNIQLTFSGKNKSFMWSTNTLIREGSIFNGGCIPEVEYHFKMDANSGIITDYSSDNHDEYLSDIYY